MALRASASFSPEEVDALASFVALRLKASAGVAVELPKVPDDDVVMRLADKVQSMKASIQRQRAKASEVRYPEGL